MGRFLAVLLSVAFSFSLMLPALAAALATPATAGSRLLPACCRRDGNHHCSKPSPAQRQAHAGHRGALRIASAAHCPLFPSSTPVPVSTRPAGHAPALAFSVLPAAGHLVAAISEPDEAQYRQPDFRNSHKRGPPALLRS